MLLAKLFFVTRLINNLMQLDAEVSTGNLCSQGKNRDGQWLNRWLFLALCHCIYSNQLLEEQSLALSYTHTHTHIVELLRSSSCLRSITGAHTDQPLSWKQLPDSGAKTSGGDVARVDTETPVRSAAHLSQSGSNIFTVNYCWCWHWKEETPVLGRGFWEQEQFDKRHNWEVNWVTEWADKLIKIKNDD